MAFDKAERAKVFRTVTAGDYLIGRIVGTEPGKIAPSVLVETYSNTETVKATVDGVLKDVPKAETFIVYDLNMGREVERRQRRDGVAKATALREKRAHKVDPRNATDYVLLECLGANDSGYPLFEASFSNIRADIAEERKKRGAYYVFHEQPKDERPAPVSGGGGGAEPSGDGVHPDDLPF